MKLKRFVAPDTRTAMQQIKATFGPDAVILSSNRVEGGVEIVAAIDFDETVINQTAAIAEVKATPVAKEVPSASPLDDMRQEILTLRGMLETQIKGSFNQGSPLQRLLSQKLIDAGVSYKTASHLTSLVEPHLNQKEAWHKLLNLFAESLPLRNKNRIEEGGIYAFVGPTGVGKTTTLAKIAARFVLRFGAENLGLITMDTYRIAAHEQLLLYGKILSVKVSVAEDEMALDRVLRQLSDKKLILIDTAGLNPNDARVAKQMELLHEQHHSISTVLVLPATSHYQVLNKAIENYNPARVDQCIITKIDEAFAIGGILSAIAEHQIEVSYLTHGQRVPEDIKLATCYQLIEELKNQEQALRETEIEESKGSELARRLYVEVE